MQQCILEERKTSNVNRSHKHVPLAKPQNSTWNRDHHDFIDFPCSCSLTRKPENPHKRLSTVSFGMVVYPVLLSYATVSQKPPQHAPCRNQKHRNNPTFSSKLKTDGWNLIYTQFSTGNQYCKLPTAQKSSVLPMIYKFISPLMGWIASPKNKKRNKNTQLPKRTA